MTAVWGPTIGALVGLLAAFLVFQVDFGTVPCPMCGGKFNRHHKDCTWKDGVRR